MKYYYLITSLPDLVFGMGKPSIEREVFETLVSEALSKEDKDIFDVLKSDINGRIDHADTNIFFQQYFTFERNLRNFLTGINMKKLNRPFAEKISGPDDFVTNAVRFSNLPDFGVSKEIPYAGRIMELLEGRKYVHLEQYIDKLRFDTIDEMNRFNYFTIEYILGYFLQLEILERWRKLTVEQGKEHLAALSEKDVGNTGCYQYIDPRNN